MMLGCFPIQTSRLTHLILARDGRQGLRAFHLELDQLEVVSLSGLDLGDGEIG